MPTDLSIVLEQISSNSLPNEALILNDNFADPLLLYTDKVFKQLVCALPKNNTLKQFTLDGMNSLHSLNCMPETAQAFGKALGNISTLDQVCINLREERSLVARENTLGFLQCLTGTAKIKQLTLKLHYIDNELLAGLSTLLQRNKSLEMIDIERSSLTPCAYDGNIFFNFINTLKNKSLKKLAIRNLPLGNKSGALLFAKNTLFLEELCLSNCSLTADAVPLLNEYLRDNHKLRRLHLTNLPFTLEGVQQLTVDSLQHLHTLELSCCNLKDEILSYLINHIVIHLSSLHELDLSINSISLKRIDCFKQLIEINRNIKILRLDGCKFGEQHLLKLKDTLSNPHLCQLERFSFWSNIEFSLSSVQLTVDILRNNDNLLEFVGPHTLLVKEIQEALQVNKNKNIIKIKNAQSQFIDSVITLAQGFNENQNTLSRLPVEVIREILCSVGENTLGMDNPGITLCIVLILQNIGTRKNLIERKEYNPTDNNINRWWSTQCTYQNKRLSLFSQRKPLPIREEAVAMKCCCSII